MCIAVLISSSLVVVFLALPQVDDVPVVILPTELVWLLGDRLVVHKHNSRTIKDVGSDIEACKQAVAG